MNQNQWRKRPDIRRIRDTLFNWLTLKNKDILEIGPLDKPLLDKSDYRVKYLDHANVENLKKHIANNKNRNPDAIVELDYIQEDRLLSNVVQQPVDLIVSSHVLEHLPNLFGWLREAAKILKPGGQIFAVVPDRRYTFDLERPATSIGTLLENDVLQRTQPSPAMAFDERYYHRLVDSNQLWQNYVTHYQQVKRTFSAVQAMQQFQQAQKTYVDCHCNLFDLQSLDETLIVTQRLGVQPFKTSRSLPTSAPFLDFIILLEKT